MRRVNTSFYIGIIGSVAGILFVLLSFTPLGRLMDLQLYSPTLVIAAILFSFLALVACLLLKRGKEMLAGFLMLVAAVGGIISMSVYYLLPGFLLIFAGFMSIINKKKSAQ